MQRREKLAWWIVTLGVCAAAVLGCLWWAEVKEHRHDREESQKALRLLQDKAMRGMILEAERTRDTAQKPTPPSQ